MNRHSRILVTGSLFFAILLAACANPKQITPPLPTALPSPTPTIEPSEYWPTEGWRKASPEEMGLDSSTLADMIERIQIGGYNIHSLSVIRNGYLVLDVYFSPYNKDLKHIIHSCTKSITSALIGIAIDQGLIESVEQPLLGFFPDKNVPNPEQSKQAIKLKDVLTMSSGLDCRDSYLYDWRGLDEMRASSDWVEHMLNLPMANQPGSRFEYCNGGSYLLSAILQQVSGMTALEFAVQHLFTPLGITEVDWPDSPQGINIGWGEMRLKPLDMAKIGYLFLNQGRWDDQQIMSPEWVEESTTAHISAGTLSDSYGYQWWVDQEDYFMALGYAGQTIFVLPAQDMVVVFTSGLAPQDFFMPEKLLNEFILPSEVSSNPLPDNKSASARLRSLIDNAQAPVGAGQLPLPPGLASEVSGKTYVFEEGAPFKEFSLSFINDSARFQLTWSKTIDVDVGLDDNYRLTDSAGYLRAYKGFWSDDNTFHVDYQVVGYSENGSWEISFEDDQAAVSYYEQTTGWTESMLAYRQADD